MKNKVNTGLWGSVGVLVGFFFVFLVFGFFGVFFKEHIKEMLLFLACGIFLSKLNLHSFEIKEKNIKKAINSFIS